METIITIGFTSPKVETVSVTVEDYVPPRVPNPSQRELNTVPARFRCFVCQRIKGKKHFGGYIALERVCRLCYPSTDEHDIFASQPKEHRPATRRNRRNPPFVKDVWSGITAEMVNEGYDELVIRAEI